MPERSIDEIAMELIQLQDNEPPKPDFGPGTLPTSRSKQQQDRHWSWRMTVHNLRQDLYRRIGRENGDKLIVKMQKVMKLLT